MFALFAIAFLACLALSRSMEVHREDDVAVLEEDNIDQYIEEHGYAFIKLYAPWCGHCKQVSPIYSEFAAQNPNLPIAQVDCDKHRSIGERFNLRGFPTFVYVNPYGYATYNGPRDAEGWNKFISEMDTTSAVEEVSDKASFEKITKGVEQWFIAFGSNAADIFNAATMSFRSALSPYPLLFTSSQEVIDHVAALAGDKIENLNTQENFYLVSMFDELYVKFIKNPVVNVNNVRAVTSFIDAFKTPAFGELTADNFADYMGKRPLVILFAKAVGDAASDEKRAMMSKFVKENPLAIRDSYLFSWIDVDLYAKFAENFKAGMGELVVLSNADRIWYGHGELKDADALIDFLVEVKDGKVEGVKI